MGFVLAATHLRMGGPVALKMLLPELAVDPTFVERFVREAHAASKIKSEHVARVLDVETLEDGLPLIVMELLEGHDLGQEVERNGPVPLELAADYVLQACEALAEAHSKGIVHRDLKPANLFLTQRADGSRLVKVMDFGIAKALADSGDDSLTATQDVVGSPLYMSPEQLRSSKDVDARTDVWSLGVILYELVSGDLPFVGPSSAAVLAAVAADRPRPIESFLPDVPPAFTSLLEKALEKDPDDRYANVADFATQLGPLGSDASRVSTERVSRTIYGAEVRMTPPSAEGPFRAAPRPASLSSDETLVAPGSASRATPPASTKEVPAIVPQVARRQGLWVSGALGLGVLVMALGYFIIQNQEQGSHGEAEGEAATGVASATTQQDQGLGESQETPPSAEPRAVQESADEKESAPSEKASPPDVARLVPAPATATPQPKKRPLPAVQPPSPPQVQKVKQATESPAEEPSLSAAERLERATETRK